MTTYVVPVLALLWGTVDHETISSRQMLAIAGVLAMVALVQTGSQPAMVSTLSRLRRRTGRRAAACRRADAGVGCTGFHGCPPESQVA